MALPLSDSLIAEWHTVKNADLNPADFVAGSNKRVWWVCGKGHEWEALISERSRGTGCPVCAGRRILPGFNDFATFHPTLASQWHLGKNVLKPFEVSPTSHKKVWWRDEYGHEWETSPAHRVAGNGCPVCSGKQILVGFNDLATVVPVIAAEWHPVKNEDLTPEQVTVSTNKKVWWQDKHGHEWQATINNRVNKKSGCPICYGRTESFKPRKSLDLENPKLALEWHPTKNGTLTPNKVSAGSHVKAWWLGECGHEWEATISHRFSGRGCPVCAGRTVITGINDLSKYHPTLAAEWHPSKNGNLMPTKVTVSSSKKVWWLCSKGHEWPALISDRSQGKGCPKCSNIVSKAEREIAELLRGAGLNVVTSDKKVLQGKELDIYLPDQKFAIEFNGLYWHTEEQGKDRNYHYDKWKACYDQGIQLVQIWEDDWTRNKTGIINSLKHKLGVGEQVQVMARKTVIASISKAEAQVFLEANHIQGYAAGSYYLGLKVKENKRLVSVLVLRSEDQGTTLNIVRYATSAQVVGGFTKLLKHAEKTYKPDKFITFSDHCISNGGLYSNNGFVADKELPPDYMYVVDRERKHKFGYRLKRFRNDPELQYVEGLSERELAELNGLPRVWDAGKTRWVRETCVGL